MKNWQSILDNFKNVRVLVVGDVMLDRYWWGSVTRVSPEAPVPVVKLDKVTNLAGGAANVAANVSSLGAKAFLVGAIGDDETGRALAGTLSQNQVDSEHLVRLENRPTITKTRIVAHQQHVVRVDDEHAHPLDDAQAEIVWRKAVELLEQIDVVILSDYNKGCLCDAVLSNLIKAAAKLGKPVLVDPKGKQYQKYNGATVLTPNKMETAVALGIEISDDDSMIQAGEKLLEQLDIKSLLLTLGEGGMRLFERGGMSVHFPTVARKVYDVTGAGDTVIAALGVAVGARADLATAAQIANAAAGLAVESVGTTAVTQNDLLASLQEVS